MLNDLFACVDKRLRSNDTLLNCTDILSKYNSDDWKDHVRFDEKTYTRIIIRDMTNELFEIILICWDKNQKSPIHDHPENGCIVKILQGELTEDVFIRDTSTNNKYQYKVTGINRINAISYMQGNCTIHKISNTNTNISENYRTVSLHIYSPPKFKYTLVADDTITYLHELSLPPVY